MQTGNEIHLGDCLELLRQMPHAGVDLAYLDPPFFTQRKQESSTRDLSKLYSFDDRWNSIGEYASYMHERLLEIRRVLKDTGTVFFHCDRTASHIARLLLDDVFGAQHFQSEIIWSYKRWSNSSRKLLPAHQTIFFYSKGENFKFNTMLTEYSPTTNIDQILQKRSRDERKKSVYARDENGEIQYGGSKKGVPLSDVWEIPYLNPKARERCGYPTQKPITLLERIILLATDKGDTVLDPFCGSGTTLVAAKLLEREYVGMDVSEDAVRLARARLLAPFKTESNLLINGVASYNTADNEALALLGGIPHTPVQRNAGIDAFLLETYMGVPIPLRVQRAREPLETAAYSLYNAAKSKNAKRMVLIVTEEQASLFPPKLPKEVLLVESAALRLGRVLENMPEDLPQVKILGL